jgi:hypothetical protein
MISRAGLGLSVMARRRCTPKIGRIAVWSTPAVGVAEEVVSGARGCVTPSVVEPGQAERGLAGVGSKVHGIAAADEQPNETETRERAREAGSLRSRVGDRACSAQTLRPYGKRSAAP